MPRTFTYRAGTAPAGRGDVTPLKPKRVVASHRAVQPALPGPLVEVVGVDRWYDAVNEATMFASEPTLVELRTVTPPQGVAALLFPSGRRPWRELAPGDRLVHQRQMPATTGWRIRWRVLPPSQNEIMRTYRHKKRYQSLVNGWRQVLWAAMVEGRIPKATRRRRIDITRYVRSETYRLDRGNLVGGCKPVLDAAVQAGLLIDDREEHLDDRYHQAIDPVERVEIYIRDL